MGNNRTKVLFISRDGYGQSYLDVLFLPIFETVNSSDVEIKVLQFRPLSLKSQYSNLVKNSSLKIYFGNYSSGKLFPLIWDVICGIIYISRIIFKDRIKILHARSYVTALMVVCIKFFNPKIGFIFDTDGLLVDERVEFGNLNPKGFIYKTLIFIERNSVKYADAVITRTDQGKDIIFKRAGSIYADKFYVIPNGKDIDVFKPLDEKKRSEIKNSLGLYNNEPVIVYAGSIGPQYLIDRMFLFFSQVQKLNNKTLFLFLTNSENKDLRSLADKYKLPLSSLMVKSVEHDKIPLFLGASDLGLALRKPSLSQQAVSPIKVCEYLLCGLPVLVNIGFGDLEKIFSVNPSPGLLIPDTEEASLKNAALWFNNTVINNRSAFIKTCRQAGILNFGLEGVRNKYRRVYASI